MKIIDTEYLTLAQYIERAKARAAAMHEAEIIHARDAFARHMDAARRYHSAACERRDHGRRHGIGVATYYQDLAAMHYKIARTYRDEITARARRASRRLESTAAA